MAMAGTAPLLQGSCRPSAVLLPQCKQWERSVGSITLPLLLSPVAACCLKCFPVQTALSKHISRQTALWWERQLYISLSEGWKISVTPSSPGWVFPNSSQHGTLLPFSAAVAVPSLCTGSRGARELVTGARVPKTHALLVQSCPCKPRSAQQAKRCRNSAESKRFFSSPVGLQGNLFPFTIKHGP